MNKPGGATVTEDDGELTEAEIRRFARHIVLPEIGGRGQARLLRSRVLVVGAGGLGSPLLLYLAAAGVGTLGVVDHDTVDEGNLQRQIVHDTSAVGHRKTESARARIAALAPAASLIVHHERLTATNADRLVAGYDLVADGSDNVATRVAVHDGCLRHSRALVSGAVQGMDGQLTTYKAHLGPPHPCLHCVFPSPPSERALPSCAQAGVLGPAAGVVGTLQAVEVIKELLGIGESLSGRLLLYDAAAATLDAIHVARREDCPHCRPYGEIPTFPEA
jgi:molybdopterin/thiamine biosynthesis adenylyltransferase